MLFEDGFPPPAVDDTNIETFFMEVAHDENMDHLQFSW